MRRPGRRTRIARYPATTTGGTSDCPKHRPTAPQECARQVAARVPRTATGKVLKRTLRE